MKNVKKNKKIMSLTSFAIFLVAIAIVPIAWAENGNITPVTTPFITIDPIGNHTIGDVFFINGTTNLAAFNESLRLIIFEPNPSGVGSSYTSNVSIQFGKNGVNTWSDYVTPSQWTTSTLHGASIPNLVNPGDYTVIVEAPSADAAQFFSMVPSESRSTPSQTLPVASYITTMNSSEITPLTVQFVDTSTNFPTSWLWSFGDGNSSTSQNPSHTYTSAGTYTVTLTATNAAGSNTTSESGMITVNKVIPQTPPVTQSTTQSSPLSAAVPTIVLAAIVIMSSIYRRKRD